MSTVVKHTTWIPVSDEGWHDAPLVRLHVEYAMSPDTPLTPTETLTGWRSFTSSEGYSGQFKVGWRLALDRMMRQFARDAWPEDYADEDDCA